MSLCPSPLPNGYDCTVELNYYQSASPEQWLLLAGGIIVAAAVLVLAFGLAWRLSH